MHNKMRGIKKFFGLFIILIASVLIPMILSGMETDKKPEKNSESQGEYVFVVKGDHISLKAKDASLKDILEEIGRRMKIEVVANIPREQKITIELDMIYLEDALKRFKTNYAYITKTEKERGNITKIVLVPKGGGKMLPNKFEYNPQPPIQEYNPQPPIQKFEKHESQPSTVTENGSQPSTVTEDESQSSSKATENESRSSSTVNEDESQSSSKATEDESQPSNVGSGYDPQPSITEKK